MAELVLWTGADLFRGGGMLVCRLCLLSLFSEIWFPGSHISFLGNRQRILALYLLRII